jgi:hypothetical protein
MNDFSQAGLDEYNEADPVHQVRFRGEHLWIDGVHISPWDCPVCLKRENGRCVRCSFFDPASCRLRHDTELKCDLKSILDEYRERRAARLRRKTTPRLAILRALQAELRAHGRPLHYTVLTRIVADRYPRLQATETNVVRVMSSHPEMFEKTAEGVYQVRAA